MDVGDRLSRVEFTAHGPRQDAERDLFDEPGDAKVIGGGAHHARGSEDQVAHGVVSGGAGAGPHGLGRGDHRVRKMPVPQHVPARPGHQVTDRLRRVDGWSSGHGILGEFGDLGVEHAREDVILRWVVAVESAQCHPRVRGDLVGGDPVELPGSSEPAGRPEDGGAAGLLVIVRWQRRTPPLTDSRHPASIGATGGRAAGVPVSGTARPGDGSVCDDRRMVDSARYGPWAVIAGGSEGVGAEFARLVAESGINLVLIARKPSPLAATAAACRHLGVEVRTVATDLVEAGSIDLIAEVTADLDVGLLIFNAGANTCSKEFLDGDLPAFQRVLDLNLGAMMALVAHFGRPMRDRRRGGLLLVGSMAGYLGSVRHTVYGGVKAFGRIFAESLWLELREYDVHVLELVLGVTRTPAMERVGLNFDVPGLKVAEPADVAREGLDQLPNGPVFVAGGNEGDVARRNDVDRAKVVLGTHRFMQQLIGPR